MSHSIKNPGLLVAAKKRIIDVSRWLGGYHGTHAVIVVASLLIIAIIWVALTVQLRNERQDIVNGVIKDNANLARAYEEHAIRTFKGVDAVALFLKHEYARSGSALDIGRYINNGTIDSRLFTVVSILDEQGTVVASAGVPLNLNFADREYFKVHLQQDSGKAYISKPTVGRVSGKWAFQLTRRINKPDGRFGGIVSVGINPVYFANFYQQSDLGESGLAMLVGLDGISRVRQAGRVSTFGQDLSNNTLLTYRRNKPVGNFLSAGKVEGVPRYVSYRTLAEYPLMVAVGTSGEGDAG